MRDYPYSGFGARDLTVDINPRLKPDFLCDVRFDIPRRRNGWEGMLIDTPYSREEAEHYGTAEQYPEPEPLLRLCLERLRRGGRLGLLHWYWPSPPKEVHGCRIKETFVGLVTTGRRSRARYFIVFEKGLA